MSESHIKTEKPAACKTPMWLRLLPGFVPAWFCSPLAMRCSGNALVYQPRAGRTRHWHILLGIIAGSTVYRISPSQLQRGGLQTPILPGRIILYWLPSDISAEVADVGISGVIIDAVMLTRSTFLIAYIGRKWFGLDRETVILMVPAAVSAQVRQGDGYHRAGG